MDGERERERFAFRVPLGWGNIPTHNKGSAKTYSQLSISFAACLSADESRLRSEDGRREGITGSIRGCGYGRRFHETVSDSERGDGTAQRTTGGEVIWEKQGNRWTAELRTVESKRECSLTQKSTHLLMTPLTLTVWSSVSLDIVNL